MGDVGVPHPISSDESGLRHLLSAHARRTRNSIPRKKFARLEFGAPNLFVREGDNRRPRPKFALGFFGGLKDASGVGRDRGPKAAERRTKFRVFDERRAEAVVCEVKLASGDWVQAGLGETPTRIEDAVRP